MADMFDLTERVALVTGASRGIGEAIAKAYAQQGARIVVSSRKQEACQKVAQEIVAAGGEAVHWLVTSATWTRSPDCSAKSSDALAASTCW